MVGDLQRLQHLRKSHSLQCLAQCHVNAHQHHTQLIVGQHHAHRHLYQGHARMLCSLGLQQLGVAGIRKTRRRQGLFVQRRCHQRCHFAAQRSPRSPLHALPSRLARQSTHLPPRLGARQIGHGPQRHATRRRLPGLGRVIEHSQGHQRLAWAQHAGSGTAQRGHFAHHKAAAQQLRRITKSLHDGFRANACTVALGDSDGQT